MKFLTHPRSLSLLCLLAIFPLLSGCAANLDMPDTVLTPAVAGAGDVHGNVYGGRQPITGAHIYLYGAANTGYGATGISLLGNTTGTTTCTSPLTADSSGNCYYTTSLGDGSSSNPGGEFNLTGLYKCNVTASGAAQAGQQVWLYSIGGMPGVVTPQGNSGNNVTNPAAAETAALGTCPTSGNFSTAGNGALSYIYVNEVSTVAFAYAVAGFAGTQTNAAQYVGALPGHYAINLGNAFVNAAQLYDIQGGGDPGDHGARRSTPSGNGAPPYLLINTVADAMSVCINSNNTTGTPSAGCQSYFQAIYGTNNYPATVDTASAAIYLAKHPGSTTAANVFSVAPSETPWQPTFVQAGAPLPTDATAAITFSQLNGAYGIVLDSKGNAFVTEDGPSSYLVELPSAGPAVRSSTTLDNASGIALDSAGNLWTPGQGASAGVVYEFASSTLTPVGSSPYSYTNGNSSLTNSELQIAADASGYVYIADYNNSDVLQINSAAPLTPVYLTDTNTCTDGVIGIAYSNTGTFKGSLWVTGSGTTYDICDITKPTTKIPQGGVVDAHASINPGQYVAVDSNGYAYATALDTNIYKVTTSSVETTISGGNNLVNAGPVAIDGANNIWIINNPSATNSAENTNNSFAPSIAEFCTGCSTRGNFVSPGAIGTATGFQYGLLSTPKGIAIDGSGDVWVTNNGLSQVKELIGAAVPVTTPLYQGTGSPNVDQGPKEE